MERTGFRLKRFLPVVLLVLLVSFCSAVLSNAAEQDTTRSATRSATLSATQSASPRRIISLAPNLTEILYELGLSEQVVGVTDLCDRPGEARLKPKVGGMTNPSLEAIVRLRPDLVVMSTDGNVAEFQKKLLSFGIDVYVFDVERLAELAPGIRGLGKALEATSRAQALASQIENSLEEIRQRNVNRKTRSTLFIVWPEPLVVAGSDTHINDALTLLGLSNIAAGATGRYPKFSLEEVMRRSPEIIFTATMGQDLDKESGMDGFMDKFKKRLSSVDAVRNDRVYYLSDLMFRLAPSTVDGIIEIETFLISQ